MLSSGISHRVHRGLGVLWRARRGGRAGERFTTVLEGIMAESVILEIFSDYV
jgi:hypothetical protein